MFSEMPHLEWEKLMGDKLKVWKKILFLQAFFGNNIV